jgi:outer membrane receptor protein involved in Fe transport
MKTKNLLLFTSAIALTLGIQAPLWAQTVAPSDAPDEIDGEVVVLESFYVTSETDRGYIAVDSLAGGRVNTPIKLTPSAMSSLTRAFIDDVGIQNVRDALKWSPNVVPADLYVGKQLANAFNNWDYNFRGAGQSLQGGAGPTRNYFTFYTAADSYNVDRIEFDRGPNSILFGVGTVGGVLSTYTKVPRIDKNFATITAIFDDNESMRFELDVNRRVSDRLAIRLNALYDRNRGWRKNDKNDMQAVDLAVLFKPTANTSLRVELEKAKSEVTLISSTFGDGVSRWDGTSVSDTWGAPTGGTGTQPSQSAGWWTSPYNVWIPGLASKGVMNWNGGSISSGIDPDGIPVAPYAGWYQPFVPLYSWMAPPPDPSDIPVLPSRDFTYGHGITKPEYENITAFVNHRFTDNLDAEVSYYRYRSEQNAKDYEGAGAARLDLNRQLPDGTSNPNFGKMFADFFLSQQQQNRTVDEVRAQLNYTVDTTIFDIPLTQLFSLSAGDQEITWYARQYNAQLVGTGLTDFAQNMVWGRLYFDNPNQSMNIPEVVNGRTVAYLGMPFDWFDFDESYKLKNVAFASHSRLWNDKLSILAGVRHDKYDHRKVGAHSGSIVEDGASGTTYSAGGIYYFNWLGVFVNYSKNFDPIGPGKQNGLDGKPFGPSTGVGLEYGIRISTDDGKYYASISRYDSKSQDRIFNGGKPDFQGMWRNYYDALGQPWDTSRTTLPYDDTEALDVSGWELDITANPTKNLRMSVTYGKPDSQITDSLPGARAYYAANLATWNTAASGTSTAAGNLRNQIISAQGTLDQNTAGKTKTGLVDYTASIFAHYMFPGESLKGWSIGGGMTYTGKQYVGDFGAPDGQPKFPHYGSARKSTSAVIAYETKLGKIPTRFALNIDNVLDDRDPIITGYHWGWVVSPGNATPNAYLLPAPRTFKFSARFSF